MELLIGDWIGNVVSVGLRVGGGYTPSGASLLEGKLLQIGEAGIVLEIPKKGRTVVPTSAMLYMSLCESQ